MKILNIVGARPNFMKVAPIHTALKEAGHDAKLVHTGQHYDENMSKIFFEDLGMPRPDRSLGVGSGSHAVQTARIMERFEEVVLEEKPEMVLVAGDVNSTIACALVAAKLHIPVAHLEAGLRSFDRSMPEEINRVLTDQISDLLLTPSADGDENLLREGVDKNKIHRVGNAMIDSLMKHRQRAERSDIYRRLQLDPQAYALLTLHRPANVDARATLEGLLGAVQDIALQVPVVFPVHPRTQQRLAAFGWEDSLRNAPGMKLIDPVGYLEFLALQSKARLILTDSGGIQEESTCLGVPCLTLRPNTERPITVSEGTNTLVGTDPERIRGAAREALARDLAQARIPELWDGKTAERVVRVIESS